MTKLTEIADKLTQQEIEEEVGRFRNHISNPASESTAEYISNPAVHQLLKIGDVGISSALMAWLARAELTKPKKHKFLPLTDKQLNVLSYIEQYINEKGYSPKLKEVQKALSFKSESSINAIVKHLINKGYLVKSTGWRGLELAKGGE